MLLLLLLQFSSMRNVLIAKLSGRLYEQYAVSSYSGQRGLLRDIANVIQGALEVFLVYLQLLPLVVYTLRPHPPTHKPSSDGCSMALTAQDNRPALILSSYLRTEQSRCLKWPTIDTY